MRVLYQRILDFAPPEGLRATCRLRGTRAEFELDLRDFVQAQTFLTRRYDPELVHFMRARLDGGPAVVMDVGAHIGLVATQLAVSCPNATVHAFEPHPENVVALKLNLARNRVGSVTVNGCAVSDAETGVVLSVATEGSNWHHVQRIGEGIAVRSITLDGYAQRAHIDHVDVLKLDVEGHEPSVLRGASGMLQQGAIGMIVTEIHEEFRRRDDVGDGDVRALLEANGYRMKEIPGLGFHKLRKRPENVYRNVYFEPVASPATGLRARHGGHAQTRQRVGTSAGMHRREQR